MLTNRIIFARLMALLRSIDPEVPLPVELEPRLFDCMQEQPFCKKARMLEARNRVPGKAYYVVTGFVVVFAYDEEGQKHTFRIYRKNTVVVLDCFMNQYKSPFMIWACRGTSLYSISFDCLGRIYEDMEGMKDFAWKTESAFQQRKERLRDSFLSLPDELRVLKFYIEFKELLPARRSVVTDEDIASYLVIGLQALRRWRKKLIKERRL